MSRQPIKTLAAVILFCLPLLWTAQIANAQSGHYMVHTTTAANTTSYWTYLNDPTLNGHPEQIVMVTQDWSGNGVYNNSNCIVAYDGSAQKWYIMNRDTVAMPLNACFFVYNTAPSGRAFLHRTTHGNTSPPENWTYIDSPLTNGNPKIQIFVTQGYDATSPIVDYHNIGVWYDTTAGKWEIVNLDGSAMPIGTAFHVFVPSSGKSYTSIPGGYIETVVYTHRAISTNSFGDYTLLSLTGVPQKGAFVFATPNLNRSFADNHAIGAWFNGSVWSIFNEDWATIPDQSSFNVWLRWTSSK